MITARSSIASAGVRNRGRVYQAGITLAGKGLLVPLLVATLTACAGAAWVLMHNAAFAVSEGPLQPTPAPLAGGNVIEPAAPADPTNDLHILAAHDAGVVVGLDGSWVPQVASGPADVNLAAYLEAHRAAARAYGAVLLTSDMYNFENRGYWVTVVPISFSSSAEALDWCARHSLPDTNCYAKLLTNEEGISTTAHRQ